MAGEKRRKELARQKAERQAQNRADSARRAKRNRIIAWVVIGVVFAAFIVWSQLPDDSGTPAADDLPSPTPAASASATPADKPTPGPVATPAGVTCDPVNGQSPSPQQFGKPGDAGVSGTVNWVLDTNCGRIVIALDAAAAPKTVNGLAFLTDEGYYDNSSCHRLTTAGIFVVQCGSLTGDGTDNPGFQLPDENLPKTGEANYPAGSVAMANSGPNTAGSQFFLVYQDTTLGSEAQPATYTIVGTVTEGLDVVKYVAAAGVQGGSSDATDGPPAQPLQIQTAKIEK